MDPISNFKEEVKENIKKISKNKEIFNLTNEWIVKSANLNYSYNFSWMGRPIIQYPQDILAIQEIIWNVKPDLIIETGIAHGGSLIFYASMLELIGQNGEVVGIDIDIRDHNRVEIEKHHMSRRIKMLEGSSTSKEILLKVEEITKSKKNILVVLDSNHTHEHVLNELNLYSPFVTKGSYIIVLDTIIEDMPINHFSNRPWGKGDNPKTAVWEFLKTNNRFEIDKDLENKIIITVAPDGFLKCVED